MGAAALVGACHPGPTAAVTLVGALLAAGVGLDAGDVGIFGSAVFAGQLSVGWSNDALDAGRDRAVGRLDKPAATGQVSARTLWYLAIASAAAAIVLSVPLGAGALHLVLPAAGWAYNLGLKATWWSGAAYAVGFAAYPGAPYLMLQGTPAPPWWVPTAGALFGVGAHMANVLPDLRADVATDVRGLPHRLGERVSILVMAACLFCAVAATAFGPAAIDRGFALASTAAAAALTVGAVLTAWRSPANRVTFPIVLVLAVLIAVQFALGTSGSNGT